MQNVSIDKYKNFYQPILRLGIPIAIGQIGVIIM